MPAWCLGSWRGLGDQHPVWAGCSPSAGDWRQETQDPYLLFLLFYLPFLLRLGSCQGHLMVIPTFE